MQQFIRAGTLAACMLCLGGGVQAQSATDTAVSGASFTRTDTVRAVQHIFSRHRTGGWIWTTMEPC